MNCPTDAARESFARSANLLWALALAGTTSLGCTGTASMIDGSSEAEMDAGSVAEAPPGGDAGTAGATPIPRMVAVLEPPLLAGRLSGWVHGAVHDRGLYVFTWRDPNDFFTFVDFPIVPLTVDVATRLEKLKRHDAIVMKGTFIRNKAPLTHLRLEDFTVTKTYVSDEPLPGRKAVTNIPADVVGRSDLIAKVHAVAEDGRLLVMEYGDAVVPLFVPDPTLTAGLYRNDKIKVKFTIATFPPRPTHLWLDVAQPRPLEVMERLVDRHGKPFEADGVLVRFAKSPQITVDVYALEVTDADNVTREYTLLNQNDAIFTTIREKLAAAWKSRPGEGLDGRNKLVNPHIWLHAKGTFNLIAPNQANAQILLDSADDITISYR